jgi:hypothetical protein
MLPGTWLTAFSLPQAEAMRRRAVVPSAEEASPSRRVMEVLRVVVVFMVGIRPARVWKSLEPWLERLGGGWET